MLIGSLGAASSGKSTGILGLTHQLKMQNVACEYLPEAARVVIDKLGYPDQDLIAQLEQENIDRAKAHPDRIWLSDSGIFLGQFYAGPVYGGEDYDLIVHFDQQYKAGPDSGRLAMPDEQTESISQAMALWADNQPNVVKYSQMMKPDYAMKLRA
ncbi:ATP-binding protein [Hymenobacter norwichensis]|nr:ATP-binding protein [Hymenobacter norwichensis]